MSGARRYGSISDIQLMTDRDTGRSRGFGFVTYDSTNTVEQVRPPLLFQITQILPV